MHGGPQASKYGDSSQIPDYSRTVSVPSNAESTHLRTTITGWRRTHTYE